MTDEPTNETTNETTIEKAEESINEIDLEKSYSAKASVSKLRRLADALEAEKTFEIMISGKRIRVPPDAIIEFEYESAGDDEEIEIELKWKRRRS